MTSASDKFEVAQQELVDQVLAAIDGALSVGKWEAPWHQRGFLTARNVVSKRSYTGGNLFKLAFELGSWWGTYRQWESVGAQVVKGEHGTRILVPRTVKQEREDEGGSTIVKRRLYFGTAVVFSNTQVEGWTDPDESEPTITVDDRTPAFALYQALLQRGMRVELGKPAYSPTWDQVTMPFFEQFTSPEGYYSTLFHEATHWTGHPSRLDRDQSGRFGTADYAFEELVAEFGGTLVCSSVDIPVTSRTDHLAYLKHWAERIRADGAVLWKAMALAQRAHDYLIPPPPETDVRTPDPTPDE